MKTKKVNRRPFLPMAIHASLRARLLEEPVDGVMVQMITERRGISQWAEVIEIGDRIRNSHPVTHEKLFSQLLVNRQMAQDVGMGLEMDRLGVGPRGGMLLRWLRPCGLECNDFPGWGLLWLISPVFLLG